MNYLTQYYKNLSEQLQAKVNHLEKMLKEGVVTRQKGSWSPMEIDQQAAMTSANIAVEDPELFAQSISPEQRAMVTGKGEAIVTKTPEGNEFVKLSDSPQEVQQRGQAKRLVGEYGSYKGVVGSALDTVRSAQDTAYSAAMKEMQKQDEGAPGEKGLGSEVVRRGAGYTEKFKELGTNRQQNIADIRARAARELKTQGRKEYTEG